MARGLVCLLVLALVGAIHAEDPEKLVGATNASPGEFPYVVAILVNNKPHCCGSILSNQFILTAAHCVAPLVNNHYAKVTVISGTNNLRHGGQTHTVVNMMYHPNFVNDQTTGKSWNYDIGIMKLASPMVFNELQKPIRLASAEPPAHATAVIAAWGATGFPVRSIPMNLQKLSLKTITTQECQRYFNIPIRDIMICTLRAPNIGTCSGDSGSALVYNGEVVGVVSGGIPCARGIPDIFTNVFRFRTFVTNAMQAM